jgi:AcrR family transcriptional regulator
MAPRTSPLLARKQDFVRTEIWNAALDLFVSKGYDTTTVEEIATRAGVSRRTFFRYYASKDDLMVKAIDAYGDLLAEAIQNTAGRLPPADIVRGAVVRVAEFVVAQPRIRDTMWIARQSAAARGAQLAELAVVEDRLAGEFAKAIQGHERRTYTPRLMAALTIAVLNLTFRSWSEPRAPQVRDLVDDVMRALHDLFLRRGSAPGDRRADPRTRAAAARPGRRALRSSASPDTRKS